MKLSYLSKFFAASVIGATLAVGTLSVPTLAQTNTTPGTNDNTGIDTPRSQVDNTDYNRDDDNGNWGLLGLLGLLGLAGLKGKRSQRVAYDDRPDVTSSTYKP